MSLPGLSVPQVSWGWRDGGWGCTVKTGGEWFPCKCTPLLHLCWPSVFSATECCLCLLPHLHSLALLLPPPSSPAPPLPFWQVVAVASQEDMLAKQAAARSQAIPTHTFAGADRVNKVRTIMAIGPVPQDQLEFIVAALPDLA